MPTMKMHLDGDGCWPDLQGKMGTEQVIETAVCEVALLVGGMISGKSSVSFRYDLPDGRVLWAQTSLDLLENAVKAFRVREAMIQPSADAMDPQ